MEKRWKDGGIYNVEYDCEEIEDDSDETDLLIGKPMRFL